MPKISSYNPSIKVMGTGDTIQVQLDDWYDNEEVLAKLSKLYAAKTVRELVRKIKSGVVPNQSLVDGVLRVDVEESAGESSTLVLKPGELI